MLQKNLLSKSLWCNTDTSRLIVIVHVRAVEVLDKEGHCAPTEGTARMINDLLPQFSEEEMEVG